MSNNNKSRRESKRDLNLINLGEDEIPHLPDGMVVAKDLTLYDLPSLVALPKNLKVGGELIILQCHALVEMPEGLKADQICILNCKGLETFSAEVRDKLCIMNCPALKRIAIPDECHAKIGVHYCTGVEVVTLGEQS